MIIKEVDILNIKNYFLIITLIGVIFLVGGAGTTINRTMATAACEACGMEIQKEDVSSFLILSSDEAEHWGCCPICGMVEAIYYSDSELQGQCFSCGKPIVMNFKDGELSWLDFSGNSEFIRVVLGGSCMTNKLTCSPACSSAIRLAYDWASNVPEKNSQCNKNCARAEEYTED